MEVIPIKDNVRKASNEVYFATMDGRKSWKVVKSSNISIQVILLGNTESMLVGLLEKQPKFKDMGVTVRGKRTDDGLIIEVMDGVVLKPAAK